MKMKLPISETDYKRRKPALAKRFFPRKKTSDKIAQDTPQIEYHGHAAEKKFNWNFNFRKHKNSRLAGFATPNPPRAGKTGRARRSPAERDEGGGTLIRPPLIFLRGR